MVGMRSTAIKPICVCSVIEGSVQGQRPGQRLLGRRPRRFTALLLGDQPIPTLARRRDVAARFDRVIVLVPRLFDFALDEADLQVRVLLVELRRSEPGLRVRELPRALTGTELGLGLGQALA